MIINTGVRTDIVQYFTPWLLNRLMAGFVYSRNPLFPDKIFKYELTPDKVDSSAVNATLKTARVGESLSRLLTM